MKKMENINKNQLANEAALEQLLSDKRPIKAPDGLEARIMQQFIERPKNNTFLLFFSSRNYMALASVLLVLVMASAYFNYKNNDVIISPVDEETIISLSDQDEYYDTANEIMNEAQTDPSLDSDSDVIDDLDYYINWPLS